MPKKSPGYPTLSKAERATASGHIADHMSHLDEHPGGREQAIAIGLRQAAPEKYEKFASRGGGKKKDGDDGDDKDGKKPFGGKDKKKPRFPEKPDENEDEDDGDRRS